MDPKKTFPRHFDKFGSHVIQVYPSQIIDVFPLRIVVFINFSSTFFTWKWHISSKFKTQNGCFPAHVTSVTYPRNPASIVFVLSIKFFTLWNQWIIDLSVWGIFNSRTGGTFNELSRRKECGGGNQVPSSVWMRVFVSILLVISFLLVSLHISLNHAIFSTH